MQVSNSEIGTFRQAQVNQGIALKAYAMYAAQVIPQIDTEIAQKGHFRMETNYESRANPKLSHAVRASDGTLCWAVEPPGELLQHAISIIVPL